MIRKTSARSSRSTGLAVVTVLACGLLLPATGSATTSATTSSTPSSSSHLTTLSRLAPELDRDVLALALDARAEAFRRGEAKSRTLTVIDYSLPSTAKRLWVFDVPGKRLLFHELVAHGKNTGGNFATKFSNTDGSLQTSLGLFKTGVTYYGKNGYSLKLHGLEPGVNDLALPRTIVIHGAPYVSQDFIRQQGRLGRSWGCPALTQKAARPVIDTIKEGGLVFAYYPQKSWLQASRYLKQGNASTVVARLAP